LLGIAAPASAATITGTVSFGGGVIYDNRCTDCPVPGTTADNAIIDFLPLGTGEGQTQIELFSVSGYFASVGLAAGQLAAILDLTNVSTLAGTPPTSGPIYTDAANLASGGGDGFLQDFVGEPTLVFNLQSFTIQSGPDCSVSPVSGCVVNGIFKITELGNGISVGFGVLGEFVNGADSGFYEGLFSAEFVEQDTVLELLELIASGADVTCPSNTPSGACSWSADFAPVASEVPEPATMLTFGAGAALLAARRRRRAAK